MRNLQLIVLFFLSGSLCAQTFCEYNFGYNWITTQLKYSEKDTLDTAKCIFDKVDTIDFTRDVHLHGKAYQYIKLNCVDLRFTIWAVDSMHTTNEIGESSVVWIVGATDADAGTWKVYTLHNTITFLMDYLNICYTFQIIKEKDKMRLIKIKKE
ncbi:MAG: hypothetical protein NT150_15415 [Bacteroidetes bacterium]|nr:hypothetical protein [Bacteroidota bacterium]